MFSNQTDSSINIFTCACNKQLCKNLKLTCSVTISTHISIAVPEIDDDDDENDERPYANGINTGVDDGLLGNGDGAGNGGATKPMPNGGRRHSVGYPGYDGTGFVNINGVETPIPDVNAYQHKKTLAQGMMDLALLSANANQLRYVLETSNQHPYFYPSLLFISVSIIFQVGATHLHIAKFAVHLFMRVRLLA